MMLAVAGYYDGVNVQFLEPPNIQKNQRVIVTIMNDFMEESVARAKKDASKKNAAFQRLEAWRERNKDFFGKNFDWKREVEEAIREKYGIAD